jgi:hypothetical protein
MCSLSNVHNSVLGLLTATVTKHARQIELKEPSGLVCATFRKTEHRSDATGVACCLGDTLLVKLWAPILVEFDALPHRVGTMAVIERPKGFERRLSAVTTVCPGLMRTGGEGVRK